MRSIRLVACTFAGVLIVATLLTNVGMAATAGRRAVDRGGVQTMRHARHSAVVHRSPARPHGVAPVVGAVEVVDPSMSAAPAPLVIIQDAPPVLVQEEAPPPPVQPSYSWYYCGPKGTLPQPGERFQSYCLSGIQPSVRVLPGPGKTLEQFQTDDLTCRKWANTQASALPGVISPPSDTSGPIAGSVQERYDIAYQRCMHSKEHLFPAVASTAPPGIGAPR